MLKIELLPKHFAIARTNKKLLAVAVLLLVVAAGSFAFKYNNIQGQIVTTTEKRDEQKVIADEVTELEGQISEKQAALDPIQGKVDFVRAADRSGGQFWNRFHRINKYIWEDAQVSNFSITNGSGVAFTAQVRGTTGVARFLLNLLRCPDIDNITYSGISGSANVQATGGAGQTQPISSVDRGGPMGMPGGPGAAGRPPSLPGGPAGAPGGRPPGMMAPGGAAGMPGSAIGGATTGGPIGGPDELISLSITATLTRPISTPMPPGSEVAAAAGGMPGMPGGPPAMPGGMPGGSGAVAPAVPAAGGAAGAKAPEGETEGLGKLGKKTAGGEGLD